jgi:hypothetical protein
MPFKATGERLHHGPADRRVPSLHLHVDPIEAEAVLLDDAVDAAVAGSSDCLSGVASGSPVPHGNKEVDHDLFEELRRALS